MIYPVVVLGGGGHARVLVDALRAAGDERPIAIVDADVSRHGGRVLDADIVGSDELLEQMTAAGTRQFAVGLGGINDYRLRERLFERCVGLGLEPLTIVHPRAHVSRWATVEPGAQVLAAACVNVQARVGRNAIVNTGAIVEHDCIVGAHGHLTTGSSLAGTVTFGPGAYLGIGAVVRQLVTVGEGAVIGAGAVVVRDVPAGVIVAGVPARQLTTRTS